MSKSSAGGLVLDYPTPAQMIEFWTQVRRGDITKGIFQLFLRKKRVKTPDEWRKEWQDFYKKYFGIDADFSAVAIPEHRTEFDRLIIVAQGLTLNRAYDACARQFPCWRYTNDLDKAVLESDRTPDQSYAVCFRDRREADEELKNLSAYQLAKKGIPGITLLERMLYELKYWNETKEHLDVDNITLCVGSRNTAGGVLTADWHGDYFEVSWYYSIYRHDLLCSRAAVPCPAKRD